MTGQPPKATRREWIGLGVLALPCLIYSMDLNVLNLAIPTLAAELRPSTTELLWIVDIYGFLLAGFLITMGSLGDRIGRRRLLLIGAAAFGFVSILGAFSRSAEMLIFARAMLGIAAATLAPSTLSLIRNMFIHPRERIIATGVWMGGFSAGSVIGPLAGGVLLEFFWWGSVFLLAVPVMALLLAVGPRLLPEFRDPDAGAIDMVSTLLATAAVLAVVYGMKGVAVHGSDVDVVSAVLVGVVLTAVLVCRQRGLQQPMIDVALFARRQFSTALAINVLGVFAVFGSLIFITQYLQMVRGFGPLSAGLILAPMGVAFAAGAVVAPALAHRRQPGGVLAGCFVLTACGYALIAQFDAFTPLYMVLGGLMLFASGLAPFGTVTTNVIMSLAPPDNAGAASGLSETSVEFGAALGVAVLGSVVTAVYRLSLGAAPFVGLPADAMQAARESLGGALATAEALDSAVGETLRSISRDAYLSGMHVAAWFSAALALATALLCSTLMQAGGDK